MYWYPIVDVDINNWILDKKLEQENLWNTKTITRVVLRKQYICTGQRARVTKVCPNIKSSTSWKCSFSVKPLNHPKS